MSVHALRTPATTDQALAIALDRLDRIEHALAGVIARAEGAQLEPWLTKRQVAEHLGVSPRWLDARIAEGLPRRELAGASKLRVSDVERWLAKQGYLEEAA